MKLLLVVAAALAVASCADDSMADPEFDAWKIKFGRSYNSSSEEAGRKEVWLRNREVALGHNIRADQGNFSFQLDMTSTADMEHEEFKGRLLRSSFNASVPSRGSTYLRAAHASMLPPVVDWRQNGIVTPVKDQGHCNCGWAFSATGSLEGQYARSTGKLVSLSEQQLVDCSYDAGNDGCNTGKTDNAFIYLQASGGIERKETYPYNAGENTCTFKPDKIVATCTGYHDIPQGDEDSLQAAVANNGPVSVGIDASKQSFRFYKSGVYDDSDCRGANLNHNVLIVGYGTEGRKDYWLVKNSWGESWGENGYIKMKRNSGNQCGIATAARYPLV